MEGLGCGKGSEFKGRVRGVEREGKEVLGEERRGSEVK